MVISNRVIEGLHISTCSELVHFPLDRPPLRAVTLLSAVQDVRAVVAFSEIGDLLKPILSVNLFQKRRAETEEWISRLYQKLNFEALFRQDKTVR